MTRPDINLSPVERAARLVLGGAVAIFGIVLLASASAAAGIVLLVLLILAGVDLVITGALGHCPLYARLGLAPRSTRTAH